MAHSEETRRADIQNDTRTQRIRTLNDRLRRELVGGQLLLTPGIHELGDVLVTRLLLEIMAYDDFTPDNDPYWEHDLGRLKFHGQVVLWKIDYYDRSLCYGSPDPADALVTSRVMTIMLASEY